MPLSWVLTQVCGGQRAFPVQPPALAWGVWWGRLPQRLLAARRGLPLADLAAATLYLERTLAPCPGWMVPGGPAFLPRQTLETRASHTCV